MKRFRGIALALAALGLVALGGCVAFSEEHPVTESRFITPEMQTYWLERRWRHDKADEWAVTLDRQSAARMAQNLSH